MSTEENNVNPEAEAATEDLEETLSAEETEAVDSFDLTSVGIEPMTTPIADLVKIYNENHAIVKSYTDKQKKGVSDPNAVDTVVKSKLKEAVKSEQAKPAVDSLRSYVEEAFTERTFNYNGGLNLLSAEVMLSELENLVSLVKYERDYHLNKAIQSEKDKRGIKSTPSESATTAKLACESILGLIKTRIKIADMYAGIPNLPESEKAKHVVPSNLLKTGGQRGGFNADVLPRSPQLKIEGQGSASTTHLVFRFQPGDANVEHPADIVACSETTLNDVAHNVVSQGAYRVTGKDIERKLKEAKLTGSTLGATAEEWSIEFKTGTLFGKKA